MKRNKKFSIIGMLSMLLLVAQSGCQDWLDEQPLVQLSEGSFWNSQGDALLALTGIYNGSNVGDNSYNNELLILSSATDDSSYKFGSIGNIYSGYLRAADSQVVLAIWQRAYRTIFKVNYFLENIDKLEMDQELKSMYIAEARFLRAYEYFYLSLLYGGVPLITNVLSIEEANSQSRNSLSEVMDFTLQELEASAEDLPASRPAGERGRIVKAAPLAIKGRMLMILERWAEAAEVYEEIISLGVHEIDPRYKALFEEEGEASSEIILSSVRIAGLYGNTHNQRNHHPEFYGGYSEVNPYQGMVDAFLMVDGL